MSDGSEEIWSKKGRFGLRARVFFSWDFPSIWYQWIVERGDSLWGSGTELAAGDVHVTGRAHRDYDASDYTDEKKGSLAIRRAREALLRFERIAARAATSEKSAQIRKLQARKAGLFAAKKRAQNKAGVFEQAAKSLESAINTMTLGLFAPPKARRKRR
jgi:hypothetical protein